MSYIRTAAELKDRGHNVKWLLSFYPILSRYQREDHFIRANKIVKDFGIRSEEYKGLHTKSDQKSEDLLVKTQNFARYLQSNQYDCVVVDRLCVVAAFSAHLAGIPWATVGTDGREWMWKRLRTIVNPGVFPGSCDGSSMSKIARFLYRDDFPRPSEKSIWATSPFLNISFFPRIYYQDAKDVKHPKHSHFVGCGVTHETPAEPSYLLVTFGNLFDPVVRNKLVRILKPIIRRHSIPTLFLTGTINVANDLRLIFQHESGVEIREWMAYDRAYGGALGVVGHGGTSHIWYGLREGKPLLAVPWRADQYYGGLQLERLNVGRSVSAYVLPSRLPHILRKFGYSMPRKASVYLSRRELSQKLHTLLTDSTLRNSCIQLSRLMRAGGGVQASASLLERLARFKEPVLTCVAPSYCC